MERSIHASFYNRYDDRYRNPGPIISSPWVRIMHGTHHTLPDTGTLWRGNIFWSALKPPPRGPGTAPSMPDPPPKVSISRCRSECPSAFQPPPRLPPATPPASFPPPTAGSVSSCCSERPSTLAEAKSSRSRTYLSASLCAMRSEPLTSGRTASGDTTSTLARPCVEGGTSSEPSRWRGTSTGTPIP